MSQQKKSYVQYTPATLVGLCIGDALGMPFEMDRYDNPSLLKWDGDFLDSHHHGLKAGQFTDDGQMSVALATSMVRAKEFTPFKVAKSYLDWYTSGDCRGIGGTTRTAMERLKSGSIWHESGVEGETVAGNGTAMRCAPIGVMYRDNIEDVIDLAITDAVITHNAPEPKYGSVAVAVGIALLSSQAANRETVLELVINQLPPCGIKTALTTVQRLIKQNINHHDAMRIVAGPRGYVIETVAVAYYCLVATTSFEDCVKMAVKSGGDTDTNAAVAGALAGTLYGLDGIPEKYLAGVEDVEKLKELDLGLFNALPSGTEG